MVDEVKTLEARMSLARSGDNLAYESLLKEIFPIIRNFIAKFNYRNLIDVDDLTQEVLLAIHKSSHTYQVDRSFRNWMFAIANYKLKDALRKIYRQKKLTEISFSDVEHYLFEEVEFDYEESPDLASMLRVLKPRQQKIVRLLKIECNSLQEVANKMQMTVAAVKVAAHRSYETLIKKFGKK
jgi:RNA polymerase sigma-70 factor (ECF subfamily)